MRKTRLFNLLVNKFLKKIRLYSLRDSDIHPTAIINSGSDLVNVSMGKYSYCGYDCVIVNAEIGSFCSIATGVTIGGAAHPAHFVSTSPIFLSHKDGFKKKFAAFDYLPKIVTKIGSDVWIGNGVLVKAGVSIGSGAIVGMGSVVTKDVPPYSIVAGNPARVLRSRFSDQISTGLLKSEWWNLSDSDISRMGKYFNEPSDMLKYMEDV